MMIPRNLARHVRETAGWAPVVVVTGPRQSGKSTLCRSEFPHLPLRSLEPLDARARATEDPRGFLADLPDGAVIDEVQHVPSLLPYLQEHVDRDPRPGRWVLTGSHAPALSAGVSESLAGRAAMLTLLPLSLDERRRFAAWPTSWDGALAEGGYPRIPDTGAPAADWLRSYVTTYVERDVRALLRVVDLSTFGTFLRLCAGRTAQELNYAALAGDAGISVPTVRAWLSVLEATWILVRVPAWHGNARKAQVKAPKLHFVDSGLCCHLLGIATAQQLATHPLRGAIAESWVVMEVLKARQNLGLSPALAHWREPRAGEVDIVVERGDSLAAVEVKSGRTVHSSMLSGLARFAALAGVTDPRGVERFLVYGGDERQRWSETTLLGWEDIAGERWG